MRSLLVLTSVLALLAVAAAAPASASSSAQFGVQDDAWLMYGAGSLDERVDTLKALGAKIVRLSVRWDEVAPTRPADERDPSDPAYRWGQYGVVLDALHAARIPTVVTLWGSPHWANGGRAANRLPTRGFGNFAYATAKRFPWIRKWTIWNEPNTRIYSSPVSPRDYVRHVLNPAYVLLHRANRANKVAGGVTSPRRTASGMSPDSFMRGMHAYHARLDAYAQNPYPASGRETPSHDPCSWCRTMTLAHLSQIRADVDRYFGRSKQLWLTEYGYQTSPPDSILGVSPALQAAYVGQAAYQVWRTRGVTMLIHFLVRDEPEVARWQSGFFTVHGSAKPAYRSFGLPLVQRSRSGTRTVLWGQVRPGSGRRPFVLQRWTGHHWARVGSTMRTSRTGTFVRVVRAQRGQKFRLTSARADYASPLLTIR
jgi:hypothetical protein